MRPQPGEHRRLQLGDPGLGRVPPLLEGQQVHLAAVQARAHHLRREPPPVQCGDRGVRGGVEQGVLGRALLATVPQVRAEAVDLEQLGAAVQREQQPAGPLGRAASCPSTFPRWVPLTTATWTPRRLSASTRSAHVVSRGVPVRARPYRPSPARSRRTSGPRAASAVPVAPGTPGSPGRDRRPGHASPPGRRGPPWGLVRRSPPSSPPGPPRHGPPVGSPTGPSP